MKYYRYIYKIICLKAPYKGHFYIGQHSTDNLDDGYAGSGIKISEYYKQVGKIEGVTYKKTILKDDIKSQTKLDYYEKKYIEQYLSNPKCLNIDEGGLYSKNRGKQSREYYIDEDKTYRVDINIEEQHTEQSTYYPDNIIKLIDQLKKDKYNFNIRKQLIDALSPYGLTPALLNL